MPKISGKNQVTVPVKELARAGLAAGDEVTIEAQGRGTMVIRRGHRDLEAAFGVFDGLYEPGHLDRLRSAERA